MEHLYFFFIYFFFSIEKRAILLLGKSSICYELPAISRNSLKSYVDDLGYICIFKYCSFTVCLGPGTPGSKGINMPSASSEVLDANSHILSVRKQ